jgi:DNA-binding beta-propeller fold protein YncE
MSRWHNPNRREFLQTGALLVASARALQPQSAPPQIRTLAGTGVAGMAADGDAAEQTRLNNPFGLVIGPDGALYWAEYGSHRILRLDLGSRKISIVAGTGSKGFSGDGGPAKQAQLNTPHEVRFDSKGNIFIAERDNHVVRHVDMKSGVISTAAGTNMPGFSGDGGPADKAQLNQPHSIALDRADNVFICDIMNNRVRRIDPKTGTISTFAGTGTRTPAPEEGTIADTSLPGPRSIDVAHGGPAASEGKMYLVLREGNKIFVVDPETQRLQHLAGTGELGYAGDGGPALAAKFGAPGNALNGPKGIAYSPDGSLYVADTENHVIRKINLQSGIVSTVAGTGERGDGPDGDPLKCKLARPHGLFLSGRTLYIGDSENHRIRVLG